MRQSLIGILITMTALYAHASFADSPEVKTVAAIHAEKDQLKDHDIEVKGKVVKVNNGIRGRNFVHIEDGSGQGDTAKVIATSDQTAKVGDQVVITGKVGRNIDFGMGYHYDLLIEKAVIKAAK